MNRQFSDKEPMKKGKAGFRHLGQAMLRPRRIAPEFNAPSVSKGKGKGVMAGARFFSSGSTLEPGPIDSSLVVTHSHDEEVQMFKILAFVRIFNIFLV